MQVHPGAAAGPPAAGRAAFGEESTEGDALTTMTTSESMSKLHEQMDGMAEMEAELAEAEAEAAAHEEMEEAGAETEAKAEAEARREAQVEETMAKLEAEAKAEAEALAALAFSPSEDVVDRTTTASASLTRLKAPELDPLLAEYAAAEEEEEEEERFDPMTWAEVAQQLAGIFSGLAPNIRRRNLRRRRHLPQPRPAPPEVSVESFDVSREAALKRAPRLVAVVHATHMKLLHYRRLLLTVAYMILCFVAVYMRVGCLRRRLVPCHRTPPVAPVPDSEMLHGFHRHVCVVSSHVSSHETKETPSHGRVSCVFIHCGWLLRRRPVCA